MVTILDILTSKCQLIENIAESFKVVGVLLRISTQMALIIVREHAGFLSFAF
jgi:hypothetical protein